MQKEYYEVIKQSMLCQGVEPELLFQVIRPMSPHIQSFMKETVIRKGGEKIATVGMVLAGEIMFCRDTRAGDRVMYFMMGAGRFFGLMPSTIGQVSVDMDICAKTDCTVLFLSSDALNAIRCRPDALPGWFLWNMLESLSLMGLDMLAALKIIKTHSLREAIATVLVHNESTQRNQILLHNREEMADFLCCTRPSLSRELSKMKEEGLIEIDRNTIRVLDMTALKRFC